jgi:hypothetical protein
MFATCCGLCRAMDAAVVGLSSFAFTLGKNKVCLDGCLHSTAYFSFRIVEQNGEHAR